MWNIKGAQMGYKKICLAYVSLIFERRCQNIFAPGQKKLLRMYWENEYRTPGDAADVSAAELRLTLRILTVPFLLQRLQEIDTLNKYINARTFNQISKFLLNKL